MDGPQAAAPQPPSGRDWNAVAAIIAALIGLLALAVSGYTAWLQRQQVRAEVWPYLQPGISPTQRTMSLSNKGVGPASVRRVKVFVDGRPQRGWPAVFDALGLHDLRMTPASTINGIVISPDESIQQVGFEDDATFARFYAQYPRIQLMLCYCSALNECWVYDERKTAAAARRRAVAACPATDADEFIDNALLPTAPTQDADAATGEAPAQPKEE